MNKDAQVQLLKALSHSARLAVMQTLRQAGHEGLNVTQLRRQVGGLPQSSLSQHLKVLRDAELVGTRREAQSIFYVVNAEGPLIPVLEALAAEESLS